MDLYSDSPPSIPRASEIGMDVPLLVPEKTSSSGATTSGSHLKDQSYTVSLPAATKKLSSVYQDENLKVRGVSGTFDVKAVLNSTITEHKMEDPFFIADLGCIIRKYREWKEHLPDVTPHYAVKCNPKLIVLKTLADMGVNFDCASKGEIEAVMSLGVSPDRIIYANACKQPSHIRFAKKMGVKLMTFDSANELHKVKAAFPEAQLVIRLKTDDSKSICQLSTKFGIAPEEASKLLRLAKSLSLNVCGISFHVGSGCLDAGAFAESIANARHVFDQAADLGFDFTLLDIGGGFPGSNHGKTTFPAICNVIKPILKVKFPGIKLIAEPGRFFVAASHTLCTAVIGKKEVSDEETKTVFKRLNLSDLTTKAPDRFLYYVNDGVYASFNNIIYDHAIAVPYSLSERGPSVYKCTLFGPSCDGLDTISTGSLLPEVYVGDWLYFYNMGAYTVCAASVFNGFELSSTFYINSEYDNLLKLSEARKSKAT